MGGLSSRGMNTSVPVVLLACGYRVHDALSGYMALGVARSLGRLGIQVILICDKGSLPIAFSRYWKETFTLDLSKPVDQSLHFLLNVGRRVGSSPLLLHTTERTALFAAENADALGEVFTFPKVSPTILRLLTNKWQMFFAAKENGIPVPETILPRSRDDVVKFLEGARFPIVLKSADPLLSREGTKIVRDTRDLLEEYDRLADPWFPNLMLQEYIPGDDHVVWMCNAYFDNKSECLAAFTGRKIRQYPPHAGVATLAVCEANEVIEKATRHFMKAIGYRGLVGIGYRYDARDGLYKILDVNARVSGVFRLLSSTNGMDVVRVCYLDQTGQVIPCLTPSIGRKWMLEEDVLSAFKYAREGKLTFRQWLRSLRGVQEMHWLALDDPMPFLVWCWKRLRNVFQHYLRKRVHPAKGATRKADLPTCGHEHANDQRAAG